MDPMISHGEIIGRFGYDPETGIFTDKSTGKPAGAPDHNGYLRVRIGGKSVGLHRLVFMWMFGHWPAGLIDHVNGVVTDNRFGNLRIATHTQNAQNKVVSKAAVAKGGFKGVQLCGDGRYRASITVDGVRHRVPGSFDSAADAHKAYIEACAKMFGQFERTVGAATVAPADRNNKHEKSAQLDVLKRRREVAAKQLNDIDSAIEALERALKKMPRTKHGNEYNLARISEKRERRESRQKQMSWSLRKKSSLHPAQKVN